MKDVRLLCKNSYNHYCTSLFYYYWNKNTTMIIVVFISIIFNHNVVKTTVLIVVITIKIVATNVVNFEYFVSKLSSLLSTIA